MIFWIFFLILSVIVEVSVPMMKITGLSHLFKWENLYNWWLAKYFFCPTVNSFKTVGKAFQVKLVERMPRVCKAVIKAKCGYFEDSRI